MLCNANDSLENYKLLTKYSKEIQQLRREKVSLLDVTTDECDMTK